MIAARLFFSITYLCNRPRRFFLETGLGIFLTSFCLKTCKTSLGTPFESGGVWFGSRDRPQVSGCPAGPSSLGVGYRQPPSREAFLHISLLIRPGTAILWQKTDIRTSAVVFDQKRVFFGLGRLVAVSGRGPASFFGLVRDI